MESLDLERQGPVFTGAQSSTYFAAWGSGGAAPALV